MWAKEIKNYRNIRNFKKQEEGTKLTAIKYKQLLAS
jgi:hypothetical protein